MDQDLELFKIIAVFVGVLILARIVTLFTAPSAQHKQTDCGIHKWTINPATEKLQCTVCNFVAGSHKSESGNYGE